MTQLNITGGFYESRSLPVSAQQLINAYVETPQTEGSWSKEVIFSTPGLVEVASSGTALSDANLGMIRMNGIPYFVNGSNLYAMMEDHTLIDYGEMPEIQGRRVSMAQNGMQIIIVIPGTGDGYVFTFSAQILTKITDLNFIETNGAPLFVVFMDGYFIVSTISNKFKISNLNDGFTWSALDFGTAEASSDAIVAPQEFKNRLYIFGTHTFEPFDNIGGADFPFQAIKGASQNVGTISAFSMINGRNHIYFIGAGENEGATIWRTNGQQPERVSTSPIEALLQNLTQDEIVDIYTIVYASDGAFWIGFHIGDTAIYFNEVNNKWHERQSIIESAATAWRVTGTIEAYGNTYCGDRYSGIIGQVVDDVFTEYGDEGTVRTIVTSPFNLEEDTFFLPALELTLQGGTADEVTDPNPVVRLSISKDGSRTFGPLRARHIGREGEYGHRIIWHKNGRIPTSAVLKFQYSGPMNFVPIRLDAKIKPGVPRYTTE